MGKKHLGTISLLLGGAAALAALALTQWEPDPTDVSTVTGAAFYSRGNYGEALRIFQTLADQNNSRAQFNLGIMYANGHGVVQDDEQALKWYRLAADQKDVDAQNNLGVMYLQGRGVPRDTVRAHMWFALAAAAPTAQEAQAGTLNRDSVASEMTAGQLVQARSLIQECQRRDYKGCGTGTVLPRVATAAPQARPRPVLRPAPAASLPGTPAVDVPTSKRAISLRASAGGTYHIEGRLNDLLTVEFILDTGASDVSVPFDVYRTLRASGTVDDSDVLGTATYVLADGSRDRQIVFSIRSLNVGGIFVENVRGSVAPEGSPPLLGQSFLRKFKWSIDYANHSLTVD